MSLRGRTAPMVVLTGLCACSLVSGLDGLSSGDSGSVQGDDGGGVSAGDGDGDGDSGGSSSSSGGQPQDAAGASDAVGADAETGSAATYAAAVLADNPEAYWRLSEASGSSFADSSGHGRTATLVGDATYGREGALANDDDRAIQINGYIRIGDLFDFPGQASFTIEAWVKPRLTTSGLMPIYAKMANPTPSAGTYLFVDPSVMNLGFERWSPQNAVAVVSKSNTVLPTTSFTHVVVTSSPSEVSLYVNGALAADTAHGPGVVDNATPARWGTFDGTFDELAVYSTTLSATRVKAHYDAAK